MKLEGIIFDIDGTLTSTNELIFATFNHVAEKYLNRKYSKEEIISLFGPTEDYILKNWMGDNYADARKDYYNFYSSNHEEMAGIFPGLKELIQSIKSKQVPLAIYTGKGRDSTEITLEKIGVKDYFDLIISGDDVKIHKPSPEGIERFVEMFNLNKENVLMIGDAPADVQASRSAGVKCASVLWDSYARDEVAKMGADYIFETVEELKKFMEERL